jgi:hypothetical protein
VRGGQRHSRKSWKTALGTQATWSENWHNNSLKKNVSLTLSQPKKKKEDEDADDENDDDVVRTSVSQD